MTGFANSEEAAVGLTEVVHFPREDMLKKNGASIRRDRIGNRMSLSPGT